ncbi:ABC transporter ATP-binding protein [Corynebacterium sphenisci]|uniref:ABC transporter ATP-binding protein n=1 Tax=Corynebacterium sphenisci TaxID=191493 RepID=UPI0026E0F75E|nr:ABC transporter ATP-binding protein [Corynebacterium sphenisci]MDO5731799.1 ABC transporter ATP-binding protein [Corynebacterium sphenisci]
MSSTAASAPPGPAPGGPAEPESRPPGPADPAAKRAAGQAALKELLAPVRGRLWAGRLLGAASGILAIAPYIALVRLGEVLLAARAAGVAPDADRVHRIAMLLIGTFLGQLVLLFTALAATHFADLRLGAILRDRIIDRVSRAPLAWFTEKTSGRIRKAIQDDVATLHALVAHAPVDTTVAVVTPLALVGYAVSIDWRLGLLTIAMIPIYLGLQALMLRGMGEKTAEMDTRLGHVSATAVEFADGIAVVKAFGTVGRSHARFARAADEFGDFYYDWVKPMLRSSAISLSAVSVPVLVLINVAGGAALVRAGAVTPADVVATALIALVLPGSIETLMNMAWSYELAGAAAHRLHAILATGELPAGEAGAPAGAGRVEFRGVGFSYGEYRALDGVDLTLEPGTVTALLGESGSGKSTLATMLARFQDPDEGEILLDGAPIADLRPAELYRRVAFVLQDPQLPRLSLRENIALARPEATEEEIWAAARDAAIDQEIAALPEGLDTVYGEGSGLSGGQAQRIAIARALLADADVLILDEAMSATDPDAQADIQTALNRLTAGRTVLVIAHRPESVLGADQVVVLDRGRVVERLAGAEITGSALERITLARGAAGADDHAAGTAPAGAEGKDAADE